MKVTKVAPPPPRANYVIEMSDEEASRLLADLSKIYPVPHTLYELRTLILNPGAA